MVQKIYYPDGFSYISLENTSAEEETITFRVNSYDENLNINDASFDSELKTIYINGNAVNMPNFSTIKERVKALFK